MLQESIETFPQDLKPSLLAYQDNLMTTYSELIESLVSENHSEVISKTIKKERSGSPENDRWTCGFNSEISANNTIEEEFSVKQELKSGKK